MPAIDVYNTKGEKTGKLSLPKEIFDAKINPVLMAQAVRVYLANQRQAPAKTKHRGEVAYSTRKLYRQKGTGRARHGAKSAPIFVKGGVAHGPEGTQNYDLKLSQKMKKAALKSALTEKLKAKEIIIITGLEKLSGKTKQMVEIIVNIKKGDSFGMKKLKIKNKKNFKINIVLPAIWELIIRAGKNIPYLTLFQAKQLNTYEVLNSGVLILAKESVEVLEKNLKNKK